MKFKDSLRWEDTQIELQADEGSRAFLAFFLKWFELADRLLAQSDTEDFEAQINTSTAVQLALGQTEQETETFLSMEWIGTALLLAREHWTHGEQMVEQLSVMEKRMLDQMEAIKLVELSESAKLP